MSFTVTYDGNGAAGTPPPAKQYAANDTVTVILEGITLTKGSDVFARWNTMADGTGIKYGSRANSTFVITSNTTLYAQWYTTAGLTGGGKTANFNFSYESSLAGTGLHSLEPGRTNALLAVAANGKPVCENDFQIMFEWFGSAVTLGFIIDTQVANLDGGANGSLTAIILKAGGNDSNYLRYLIVSEVTEMFMRVQHKGWFAPSGGDEQSCGEALSRFLAQQFLVKTGIGIIEPGYETASQWLNSSLPITDSASTRLGTNQGSSRGTLANLTADLDNVATQASVDNPVLRPFLDSYVITIDSEDMLVTAAVRPDPSKGDGTITVVRGYNGTSAATHAAKAQVFFNYGSRGDYVNHTLEYDIDIDAAVGCGMLFLYYLHVQLGLEIKDIVTAAPGVDHADTCLRGVYQKLTGDPGDPFPFFKRLLDDAFPPDSPVTAITPNPDNPFPLGSLSFIGVKDTWGSDECNDIINNADGLYPNAFWLKLEGFNRKVAGSATPSIPVVDFPGVTVSFIQDGIIFEVPDNPNIPQQIRYAYNLILSHPMLAAFPATDETPAAVTSSMSLLGATLNAQAEYFFVAGANPYFTNVLPTPNPADENSPYFSADLRVFTVSPSLRRTPVPHAPAFPGNDADGAYKYITSLIEWLNTEHGDPAKPDPFDPASNILPGQLHALTSTLSSVTPYTVVRRTKHRNFNFAIARVRMRGTVGSVGEAKDVKVFFRLWKTQSADVKWNPKSTYLSHNDGSGNPVWPLAPPNNHTVPFFATNSPDFTKSDNAEFGTHGVNNRTITIEQSDTQWTYFGCFLDVFNKDLTINGEKVVQIFPGNHHCLVAQIAYAGAPIRSFGGVIVSPENSDQLAQRNIQVTTSDNPGAPATHRIPQTFDTQLSVATPGDPPKPPDELMIDWGNTPVGSTAYIYWPQLPVSDVLSLAGTMYSAHLLSAADSHTLKCTTVQGATYIPIPFGTESLVGLFTIDLPPTVRRGQEFNLVVRRLSTRNFIALPPRHGPPKLTTDRHSLRSKPSHHVEAIANPRKIMNQRMVVGSFQVKIPVDTSADLLAPEENSLAIFKARFAAMAPTDRWYPVLKRYIGYISGRVDGLGGNASAVKPSFDGAPIRGSRGEGGKDEGHGRDGSRSRELCHTGKIGGLIFDRFGDFDGFLLNTEDGEEHRFGSRHEREYEKRHRQRCGHGHKQNHEHGHGLEHGHHGSGSESDHDSDHRDGHEHERRFYSRESRVCSLIEHAWCERQRVSVYTDAAEPRKLCSVILRGPPRGGSCVQG